jgi:hypothetical protein
MADPNALAPNGDGLTILQNWQYGYSPTATDVDGDGVSNNQDIDPLDPNLNQPRVPETQYAVIDLDALGFVNPHGFNDSLQILDGLPPPDGTTVQLYRLWTNGRFVDIPYPSDDLAGSLWIGPSNLGTVFLYYQSLNQPIYTWNLISGPGTLDYQLRHTVSDDGWITQMYLTGNTRNGLFVGSFSAQGNAPGEQYDESLLWSESGGEPTVIGDWLSSTNNSFIPWDMNSSGLMIGQASFDNTTKYAVAQYNLTTGQYVTAAAPLPRLPDVSAANPLFYSFGVNNAAPPIIIGNDENAGGEEWLPYAYPPIAAIWTQVGSQWKAMDFGPWDPVQKKRKRVYGIIWVENDRCEFTGGFLDANGNPVADNFWQNGHFVDLNTRTSGAYNDFIPIDINNKGAILAYATNTSDDTDANVLLLPVQYKELYQAAEKRPDSTFVTFLATK